MIGSWEDCAWCGYVGIIAELHEDVMLSAEFVEVLFLGDVKSLTFKVGVTDGDYGELHVDVHILLTFSVCI